MSESNGLDRHADSRSILDMVATIAHREKPDFCIQRTRTLALHARMSDKASAKNGRSPAKKMMLRVFLTTVVLLLAQAVGRAQQEAILDFHADIAVQEDGAVRVTETIRVRSAGQEIQRGIYRDFWLRYRVGLVLERVVPFQVLGVKRDGAQEPWHLKREIGSTRVYIGREDIILPPGEYTYTLSYEMGHMVSFHEEHDELYWNVTGNEWAFPIESASATITLPSDVPTNELEADFYTGEHGEQLKDASAELENGRAHFSTTRRLHPGEGLTVVLEFPKGIVQEPTAGEKWGLLLRGSLHAVVALGGALLVLLLYFIFWLLRGVDPPATPLPNTNVAPEEMSPAAMRYLMRMGWDQGCLSAVILSLCVKGFLELEEQKDGKYRIHRKATEGDTASLPKEELDVFESLFPGKNKSIQVSKGNRSEFTKATKGAKDHLSNRYGADYFVTNTGYFVACLVLSFLVVLGSAAARGVDAFVVGLFLSIWLTVWTVAVIGLLSATYQAWSLWRAGLGSLSAAVASTLFSIPFVFFELVAIVFLVLTSGPIVALVLIFLGIINIVFYRLLKRPTEKGRALMDRIQAYRNYLETMVQENSMDKLRHDIQPHFAYIAALGLDKKVEHRMQQYLEERAGEEISPSETFYPIWYRSHRRPLAGTPLFPASQLGSGFASALSSAQASSSRGGGGGGGFSGGGGGSRGGGGW